MGKAPRLAVYKKVGKTTKTCWPIVTPATVRQRSSWNGMWCRWERCPIWEDRCGYKSENRSIGRDLRSGCRSAAMGSEMLMCGLRTSFDL